ncbi:DNA ligase D [Granulicella mallensis]|uniref:DNA ligase (ATP) n=1 Tax=Granulicella mallensis (strain ATCC BAA-1857 / DSM 23137 / MP5ACTX8) TaxID=682795 RepID=G8NZZ5_GRAMM|nr:DNA ligase D [Granulicella mallensis]AEU35711.1 DNA ligase D [Granulicella mallensis MP5ACTX8]
MAPTKKAVSRKPASKKTAAKRTPHKTHASAADAVDEQLARYREMRDFKVTAEPSGKGKSTKAKASGLPFVIQKHAASHLHYDFRLGWNGVLKSWAVAKGPSYFTGDRRLAVQVEDHPMEYGGFEGIIPKGQYGGGTVMVWDQGTWEPQPGHEDVDAGLREGSLKFVMHGTKMTGKWTLVRMGGKAANERKPNWLLIKEHDEFERGKDDPSITDEAPDSAVTGRTLDQIAGQEDHVWNSKDTARGKAWHRQKPAAPEKKAQSPRSPKAKNDAALKDLPRETQPAFLSPQLALEATGPPGKEGWLHELKLDGYRIQARKSGSDVQLLTRKGLDWTHRMPAIAKDITKLPAENATLDGEVVVVSENGTTSFANLQASFQDGEKHPLTYFCFDLLHLNGRNTRGLSLRERKALLAEILGEGIGSVHLSEHIETGGESMFHQACELHAEGIISKWGASTYSSGRSGEWLKSKCLREQEFVIGGYTLSSEGPDRIGSLLLGYYRDGKLIYSGRTGTGFTQKTRRTLRKQLGDLENRSMPFARVPVDGRRDAIWVKPKLVAQVRFATWTADNLVRQAAFLGLREDKPAKEVQREEATVAPQPKGTSKRPAKTAPVVATHRAAVPIAAKTATKTATTGSIRLTHPDKILDAESGLTKADLSAFYQGVAEHMLPHIADRPLSLVRCPEGTGKPCFFQKHVNHMLPPGVGGIDVPNKKTGEPEPYITLNTTEALINLAQMGVLEVHPWGSRNDDLEHPDRLIFDLDPDESLPWSTLCDAAAEVRKRLKKAGLESFLKTTGGKGLHVVAPIQPELDWPQLKALAHKFVESMERENPTLYLTKMTKSARKGKIYLDYLRNERGATAVAPYSPRARAGAHVSLPLPWSALKLPERPVYSVKNFDEWRSRLRNDPWKAMLTTRQKLDPASFEQA